MNTPKVAAALNTISLAFGELAEALEAPGSLLDRIEAAPVAPRASHAAPAAPEFPPFEPTESAPYEAMPLAADTPGLGRCPTHNTTWTVKAAGVSKAGKPYNSFWKCDGKDADGTFCNKKPVKSWADTHPL